MKNFPLRGYQLFLLKCLAVGVILVIAIPASWKMTSGKLDYFLASDRYVPAAIYLAMVIGGWLGIIITPFLRPWPIRVILAVVLLAGFSIDQLFIELSGAGLSINMAKTFLQNTVMTGFAIAGFFNEFLSASYPFILAAVIYCLPVKSPYSVSGWFSFIPIGAILAVTATVHLTRGGAIEFAAPFAVPAKFAVASLFKLYDGKRREVDYPGPYNPMTRNVILIVDESVRADFLGVNNPRFANTPYLSANREKFANFGTAISSWNCSKESRLILRTGMQPAQLPDNSGIALRQPTIWQYARKAGYKTVLMDAWSTVGNYHSYMNETEYAQIDERIYLAEIKEPLRDLALVDRLVEVLASDKPTFTLVNKFGVHFPYYRSYPSTFSPFDTGATATPGLNDRIDLVINSYNNAIQWSLDRFFADLMKKVSLENTVIIYTSDHGQSLFQGGYKLTHCSKGKVHPGEARVPIFVTTGQKGLMEKFKNSASASFDKMTHFQIFPTLLGLMGFEKKWVSENLGSDLLSSPPENRRFMTGDMFSNVRGNKWIEVD